MNIGIKITVKTLDHAGFFSLHTSLALLIIFTNISSKSVEDYLAVYRLGFIL